MKALLIATYEKTDDKRLAEEHLDELAFLAETYRIETVEKVPCPLRQIDPATYLGKGKLEELAKRAEELSVDLILFDEEMSPAQQRNLQELFKKPVMDRTELILKVFEERAHTKEARLQVELAEVRYQLPRLKNLWGHLHRQTGSGKSGQFVKGEGEKQIEIDRRILKTKIYQLEKEIKEVEKNRHSQRKARVKSGVPVFAIIGYTNVGKSTLLNALTDAGVFVENKLFATLDTTTRKFSLPNNQEILLVDTVGFIRKLPHLLVAAFKGTLEESMQADILIHLIDTSHPHADLQAQASYQVLKELNVENKPVITVLNKTDLLENSVRLVYFRTKYPGSVAISATERSGFDELLQVMMEELKKLRRTVRLRIPQEKYALASEVLEKGVVHSQEYEGNDIILEADLPELLAIKLAPYTTPQDS